MRFIPHRLNEKSCSTSIILYRTYAHTLRLYLAVLVRLMRDDSSVRP